jgi:predicted nuclease with TOPRIM domain
MQEGQIVQHRVQSRLDELRNEMNVGQQRMQDLERELARLRDTMLRISGAIQVLEELQAAAATADNGNGAPDPAEAASGTVFLGV